MGERRKPALLLVVLALSFQLALVPQSHAQQDKFVTIAPEPKSEAWWLRVEFHPFGTEIRGIPVAQIDPTWCKATEFRNELFPREALPDLTHRGGLGGNLAFSVDRSFDGSKTRQTALIGAYESCAGKRGSFLLVLANPPRQPAAVRFVRAMPDAQFGMLGVSSDSTIHVFHCLECDQVTRFRWDKRQRRFVQLPPGKNED